jgi:mRNA interferase MazF
MTCDAFEVVVVPFPFTDSTLSVKRPAAVLSRRAFNAEGHTVMAMITDARNPPWPLDIRIDHQSAGLKMPSVVRMKFFTLDNRLVIREIGRLSPVDRQKLLESLRQVLPPLR